MIVKIVGGHGGVCPGFRATSYLIDGTLLIDAGSVASGILIEEQLLIENILISHPHLDHIAELAYLSDNCFGLKDGPFHVYSSKTAKNAITKHIMNDVIWPDFSNLPSPKRPTVRFHDLTTEEILVLGDYKIRPVHVNHPGDAYGFIIEKNDTSLLFTQDTGPTERIWEWAKQYKNIKAIFSEVSFPNRLKNIATASQHHTANSLNEEIKKMPPDLPIFVGHLKPNYQKELYKEIEELNCKRITIIGTDDSSYVF